MMGTTYLTKIVFVSVIIGFTLSNIYHSITITTTTTPTPTTTISSSLLSSNSNSSSSMMGSSMMMMTMNDVPTLPIIAVAVGLIAVTDSSSSSSSSSRFNSSNNKTFTTTSSDSNSNSNSSNSNNSSIHSNSNSYSSNSNSHSSINSNSKVVLPDWIMDYITWHTEQRTLYTDIEILTNPNAPSILIHYSDQYSEGLAGRFTKIHRLLWFAYDRKLLLLMVFYDSPMPLETFLIPPSIDTMNQEFKSNIDNRIGITWNWTLPILTNKTDTASNVLQNYESVFGRKKNKRKKNRIKKEKARKVKTKESSELDNIVSNRKLLFFDKNEIVRIGQSGHINIRLDRIPTHIDNNKSNTTTTTTTTGPGYIPFSSYWKLFFQPSIELQHRLDKTYQELKLIKHTNNNNINNNNNRKEDENDSKKQNENENQNQLYELIVYDAIHCRIRHPAHHNIITHEMEYDLLDKERRIRIDMNIDDVNTTISSSSSMSLLDWKNQKEDAIRTANHAVQCSNWLTTSSMTTTTTSSSSSRSSRELPVPVPIYFFSDSQELVKAMIDDNNNDNSSSSSNNNSNKLVGRYNAVVTHLATTEQVEVEAEQVEVDVAEQVEVEAEQAELELVYLLEGYYSTFIDLYIASNARCITMGVGRFAYLASRISTSSSSSNNNDGSKKCVQLHENHSEDIMKRWGFHSGIFNIIQQCPI